MYQQRPFFRLGTEEKHMMVLGMTLAAFTLLHVLISLVGIFTGFVVVYGLLNNDRMDAWTALFLGSTILTSVTGFAFPFEHLLPSHIVGMISLAVLAVSVLGRYGLELAGAWRKIYAVSAVLAFYFNFFVLVTQSFLKTPALKALAPTQTEAPFVVTQLAVLAVFLTLAVLVAFRFRADQVRTA
jgi:hypothetical protein